jgi:hypothetical protein
MPIRPDKSIAQALEKASAVAVIPRALHTENVRQKGKKGEKKGAASVKAVNSRFKPPEYKLVSQAAADACLSKADFCRKAAVWVALQLRGGSLEMTGGLITAKGGRQDERRRYS